MSQLTRLLSSAVAVAFIASACASNEKDQAQQTVQKIEEKTKEVAGDAVADQAGRLRPLTQPSHTPYLGRGAACCAVSAGVGAGAGASSSFTCGVLLLSAAA